MLEALTIPHKKVSFNLTSLKKTPMQKVMRLKRNCNPRRIYSSQTMPSKMYDLKDKYSILSSSLSTEATSSLTSTSFRNTKGKKLVLKNDLKLKHLSDEDIQNILGKNSNDPEETIRRSRKSRTITSNISHRMKKEDEETIPIIETKVNRILSVNLKRRLIVKKDQRIDLKEHKKSMIGENLFFKVVAPFDCVEEHIICGAKPEDKFARFKNLLKVQKSKNMKLLSTVNRGQSENERLLKVYKAQLTITEYKRTHIKNLRLNN